MKNLFDESTKNEIISRIDAVKPGQPALWGKMNINQSLQNIKSKLKI